MSRATILTLVRHGETPANTGGVWHGSTDSPLTARGEQQAERVAALARARFADAAALYASDLTRARRTATGIATSLGLELRLDVALREFDLGRWEGRTYRELWERERLWEHMARDEHFAPHGGESPRQVTDRLIGALRRIAAAHPAERVIVVTHGGALSMAFGQLLDGGHASWDRTMSNCAVSELVLEPQPELLSYNTTDHLEGL